MRGEYNGLTGEDIKKLILIRLNDELSKEGRLSMSQVYHNVQLRLLVDLVSYPHEPEVEKFDKTVEAKPGKKGAKKEVVTFETIEEHPVPDLSRERIKETSSGREV